MSAFGATVSGIVRHDRNHDGWPSQSDPGIPNMLVSDGFNFAVTDENGRYSLPLHEKAQTIYVQRTEQYTADITRFWHRVTPGRQTYDFLLEDARPVAGDTLSMVIVGDAETHDLRYMETIRTYLANHPETNLFINAGDISAGSPAGMETHRDFVNAATLGMPVVYACGNHDEDFRGRGFYGATDPFLAIFGPWWQSFELGGYLFVVVPIYNSWGAPLLYDMLDCGDWLKALCKRFPNKKKILVGHDLPDLVGYKMASHSGDVILDDEKFVCAIYGHKHMNIVKKYPSGRKSFCVAAPNKGGAGCFAPSFRVLRINRKTDQPKSKLFYTNIKEHLALVTPQNGMSLQKTITADAYDGGDEIVAVTANHDGQSVELSHVDSSAWRGEANWKLADASRLTLSARTKSGKEFSREFNIASQNGNRLGWLAQLPADIAMCDLQLVKGLLIVGVCDDHMVEFEALREREREQHDALRGQRVGALEQAHAVAELLLEPMRRLLALDDDRREPILFDSSVDDRVEGREIPVAVGAVVQLGLGSRAPHRREVHGHVGVEQAREEPRDLGARAVARGERALCDVPMDGREDRAQLVEARAVLEDRLVLVAQK